jgi:hypothetical protein
VHVTNDTGDGVTTYAFDAKRDWMPQVHDLLEMYGKIGAAGAAIREVRVVEVDTQVLQATLDWDIRGASGESLYRFRASYTLASTGDSYRITAIANNELSRYREAFLRLHEARTRTGE